jgi:hypothetical protein
MKLTLENILQARRDAEKPGRMEIEVSKAAFDLAKKEAAILHDTEEVLVTALLNVWPAFAADHELKKLPESPLTPGITLSTTTFRVAQKEASSLKIRENELVAGLLKLWADQPESVRKALAQEIMEYRDDEGAKTRERNRLLNP